MATIPSIKAVIDSDITDKVTANSITPTNVGGNMKSVTDEFLSRGIPKLSTTADLATRNSNDGLLVFVEDIGFFKDQATGPADGYLIFAGVGGRYWKKIGTILPTDMVGKTVRVKDAADKWILELREAVDSSFKLFSMFMSRSDSNDSYGQMNIAVQDGQEPYIEFDVEEGPDFNNLVYLRLKPTQLWIRLGLATTLKIDGLNQDTNAVNGLGLNANNEVVKMGGGITPLGNPGGNIETDPGSLAFFPLDGFDIPCNNGQSQIFDITLFIFTDSAPDDFRLRLDFTGTIGAGGFKIHYNFTDDNGNFQNNYSDDITDVITNGVVQSAGNIVVRIRGVIDVDAGQGVLSLNLASSLTTVGVGFAGVRNHSFGNYFSGKSAF